MTIKRIFNSKNIRISAVGSLIIKFLSALFAFLSSVILARLLGVEAFGIYVLAFTTVILLSIPVALGLPLLITRYVSKYEVEGNKAAIRGLLIKSNQVVLLVTVIVVGISFLLYELWWKNLDKVLVETIWYSFILLPLLALGSLRAAALRGLRYIILGQLPDTLLRNFLLCVGMLLYYFLDYTLTPQKAILIHILAATISFITGHIILEIKILKSLRRINPVFFNKEWFNQTLPFSINNSIQVIKSKVLHYILVIFGSVEAVALFEVAVKGASLVVFTLDALNTAISPYISRTYSKGNMKVLQDIIKKTSRVVFICSLPISLIFIFGGDILIWFLYGKGFELAYIPLIILCIGQLFNAATGAVGVTLNMIGHQKYLVKINLIMLVLTVVFGIPLVYFFNINGATLIISILLICQNIILVKYLSYKLKINTTIF